MKTKIIRQLQRWTRTVFSPSLEKVEWKTEALNQKIDSLAKRVNQQIEQSNVLMTALLFDRWRKDAGVLHSRAELGYWLNYLGLFGEGAEIGVYRGQYSEYLLSTWEGRRLYSIDPWKKFEEHEYEDVCNVEQSDQNRNFEISKFRLATFGARSKILRETSAQAAKQIADESLDFVYIDAQHSYVAVKEDIDLWAPKVKESGIIGGHDYIDGKTKTGNYGVKRAVDEWVENQGYNLIVTHEGLFPSWFVLKRKLQG